jgi:hypothetical protein
MPQLFYPIIVKIGHFQFTILLFQTSYVMLSNLGQWLNYAFTEDLLSMLFFWLGIVNVVEITSQFLKKISSTHHMSFELWFKRSA